MVGRQLLEKRFTDLPLGMYVCIRRFRSVDLLFFFNFFLASAVLDLPPDLYNSSANGAFSPTDSLRSESELRTLIRSCVSSIT